MKKFILAAVAMIGLGTSLFAQTETATTDYDTTRSTAVNENGDPNWYINMSYSGFTFDIPAGSVVEKGSKFTSKYPDGSFGVSLSNASLAMNQNIAYEECRRLAGSLQLKNSQARKEKFGKNAGAKATGTLQDGQRVTIAVIPYDDQTLTAVILAAPGQEARTNQFLRSLKR